MSIFRIHAYEVVPQRTEESKILPVGGSLPASSDFVGSLEALFVSSKLEKETVVDFKVDKSAAKRQHDVRDLIVDYLYGTPQKAKASSVKIATRLSNSMDNRSPATLLMLTASNSGSDNRITMWAFPQEEAFQFRASKGAARVKLLTDIFSSSSNFRKAATFHGQKRNTDFWNGRVLDRQASVQGSAANYWTERFLECRSALEGKTGTRLLAVALRKSYESAVSNSDRDQIYSAMVAVRTSPKKPWTIKKFASQFLDGEANRLFQNAVPSELRMLSFKFDRVEFEKKLNFRVFRLEDDVFVSAPFGTIGKSVKIGSGKQPKLSCKGVIVDEKLRARHA